MAEDKITDITPAEESNIVKASITEEMQAAYLDYAMSVIVSRALPDVRDGLKPVHRRIIYAMQEQHMNASGKYYKSASVVGDVMKNYHPHGNEAIYDSLVRMAQDFALRYPLVWGQGNFGSIDGDPPAAMRYTECKLQRITEELYRDIDKDTVDFMLNDLQNNEPTVLPSVLPNLLMNGVVGIAVGMATNIPPHNLGELIDGINLLIENAETIGTAPNKDSQQTLRAFPNYEKSEFTIQVADTDFSSTATVEDLVDVVKGPDFPTGGTIYNQKEIIQMYATGKGRIVTRAKMEIEEMKGGKNRIVVTEIPYQISKSTLVAKIAELIKNKKINGISDLRDESNREGLRIVIELKKDAVPKKVENRLYKYTPLQSAFNANVVALVHGEPKLLTLKTILSEFVKHRQEVVVRRTIYLLTKAKAREHILQGLKIALDNLDEVIKLIRASKDQETAKKGLIEKFDLSEVQAQAILDMQLRRLAALERKKIEDELKEIIKTISEYEGIIASPQKIIDIVKEELDEIKEKYADERRTKVVKGKVGQLSDEDLIRNEKCIVTISRNGYIKRLKEDTYKKQGRGGKGVKGQELREEDVVETIRICETHDTALFFTSKGKVYKLRVWDIPETSRTAKGTALVNFLSIAQDETVEAFLALDKDTLESKTGFVAFGTSKGMVKKTKMKDFENIRSSGIMAIKLADDDSLVWAKLTTGDDDILLVTEEGQSIRFHENKVRAMGRAAAGVIGIKYIKKEDKLIGMSVIGKEDTNGDLVVVTEKGYGKKTAISEYKSQNRGGSGILTYKVTSKTGKVVAARFIHKDEEVDMLIVSTNGKVIRLDEKQVPRLGRATLGVRLLKLAASDKVSSAAFITEEDEIAEDE